MSEGSVCESFTSGPLVVGELAIVVADALAQVDVALLAISFTVEEGSTEDGGLTIGLEGEVDVLSGTREAFAIPDEVAVVVANMVVQVNLSIIPLSISPLKARTKYMPIVNANILS